MTLAREDLCAALTCLAARFPQTFVLEGYQPHRPLKVGIAADLVARGAELDRRQLGAVLSAYTQRIMYRRAMVAGTFIPHQIVTAVAFAIALYAH